MAVEECLFAIVGEMGERKLNLHICVLVFATNSWPSLMAAMDSFPSCSSVFERMGKLPC